MENKLPTPPKSSEYAEKRNKIHKSIKDNLNYIYVVLMVIANTVISLLQISDGSVGLRYPVGVLGWTLWLVQILITTTIGVLILNAFRRQGIKSGHGVIVKIYDEYINAITNEDTGDKPRSLKQYMRTHAVKDTLSKATIFIILNILVVSVAISANVNALLALVTNIIFAVSFGIKAMLDAEDFVITELSVWYRMKVIEIQNKKKEIDNERKLQRSECGAGAAHTSGVQPQEECGAGQQTTSDENTSQPAVSAESTGIPAESVLRLGFRESNLENNRPDNNS